MDEKAVEYFYNKMGGEKYFGGSLNALKNELRKEGAVDYLYEKMGGQDFFGGSVESFKKELGFNLPTKNVPSSTPITSTTPNEDIKGSGDRFLPEGTFGDIINSIPVIGELIDDMYGSSLRGLAKRDLVNASTSLFGTAQENITDEQIQDLVNASKKQKEIGQSDEFTEFMDKGGLNTWEGWKSFGKNFFKITPELMTESVLSMLNTSTMAAGLAGAAATGATSAAIGTSLGPVGTAIGGTGGMISGGYFAATTLLEGTLRYTELLEEEMKKSNLNFEDVGDVRKFLSDTELLGELKTRALAAGLTIGIISTLTAKLAGTAGLKTATRTGSKFRAAGNLAAVEFVGESAGEAAARVVAGQDFDITETLLEGFGSGPGAILAVSKAGLKKGSYKINNGEVTRKELSEFIQNASPEQLKGAKIDIQSDEFLKQEFKNKLKSNTEASGKSLPPKEEALDIEGAGETPSTLEIISSEEANSIFEEGEKNGWDLSTTLDKLGIIEEDKKRILDENITSTTINEDEITYEDKKGRPCKPKAKLGLKTSKFTKNGKWKILKEFKGASHERGGIDIEVGNGGIKMSGKNGKFEAKFGLVIAANGLVLGGDPPIKGQATTQDSIDIYNNSLQVLNYYLNNPNYINSGLEGEEKAFAGIKNHNPIEMKPKSLLSQIEKDILNDNEGDTVLAEILHTGNIPDYLKPIYAKPKPRPNINVQSIPGGQINPDLNLGDLSFISQYRDVSGDTISKQKYNNRLINADAIETQNTGRVLGERERLMDMAIKMNSTQNKEDMIKNNVGNKIESVRDNTGSVKYFEIDRNSGKRKEISAELYKKLRQYYKSIKS